MLMPSRMQLQAAEDMKFGPGQKAGKKGAAGQMSPGPASLWHMLHRMAVTAVSFSPPIPSPSRAEEGQQTQTPEWLGSEVWWAPSSSFLSLHRGGSLSLGNGIHYHCPEYSWGHAAGTHTKPNSSLPFGCHRTTPHPF